jgi:hypothetical protein
VPTRLWNEGDTLSDLRPVIGALVASLRERVAHRRAPLARAHSPVADPAQRTDVQVGTVDADPDRRNGHAVVHTVERTAPWTCAKCGSLVPSRPVLRLLEGGKDD